MQHTKKISTIATIAPCGFDGALVQVETDIRAGLPSLQIVGMGNKAVDEARHRVRGAILNSDLQFPARKLIVNLSPAELPKHGASFDLAIATGILEASGQIKHTQTAQVAFFGELSLNGQLAPTRGVTVAVEAAKQQGFKKIFIPAPNKAQAVLIEGITIVAAASLLEVFQKLRGVFTEGAENTPSNLATTKNPPLSPSGVTFDSIVGQDTVKRALSLAIAGKHNILLYGPPGTGKTHLAKAAATLLPPLSDQDIIDTTKLATLAGLSGDIVTRPPFRTPHHSVTKTAFTGGGSALKPGEVSLAHKGILFLDELPEYPRATIEALRQPLEDRTITLSRLHGSATYPADCLLIATMNPCPCGYYGDTHKQCTCTAWQVRAYTKKLSGPILDRIDLHVLVSRNEDEYFFDSKLLTKTQHSTDIEMVKSIRVLQKKRYNSSNYYNGNATRDDIQSRFFVSKEAHEIINKAQKSLHLSGRSLLKILRVARTIADAETSKFIKAHHAAEALQFRRLESV